MIESPAAASRGSSSPASWFSAASRTSSGSRYGMSPRSSRPVSSHALATSTSESSCAHTFVPPGLASGADTRSCPATDRGAAGGDRRGGVEREVSEARGSGRRRPPSPRSQLAPRPAAHTAGPTSFRGTTDRGTAPRSRGRHERGRARGRSRGVSGGGPIGKGAAMSERDRRSSATPLDRAQPPSAGAGDLRQGTGRRSAADTKRGGRGRLRGAAPGAVRPADRGGGPPARPPRGAPHHGRSPATRSNGARGRSCRARRVRSASRPRRRGPSTTPSSSTRANRRVTPAAATVKGAT